MLHQEVPHLQTLPDPPQTHPFVRQEVIYHFTFTFTYLAQGPHHPNILKKKKNRCKRQWSPIQQQAPEKSPNRNFMKISVLLLFLFFHFFILCIFQVRIYVLMFRLKVVAEENALFMNHDRQRLHTKNKIQVHESNCIPYTLYLTFAKLSLKSSHCSLLPILFCRHPPWQM